MTVVVTDNCRGCRFTECVTVCPVSCFHMDEEMVYIDNDVCIDCLACIPVCPVEAIYDEDDLPEDMEHWVEINERRAKELPVVSTQQDPLPSAEERRAALGFAAE